MPCRDNTAIHLFSSGEWQDISASRGGGGTAKVRAESGTTCPLQGAGAGRQDDEPGLRNIKINDVLSNWAAHFAVHPRANQIFRMPIQESSAEAFPERDPSRAGFGLRVDYVVTRADGSAMRIHPRQAEGSTYSGKGRVGLAPR